MGDFATTTVGVYDKGTTYAGTCGVPIYALKSGTYPSFVSMAQDSSNNLKYTISGAPTGADIKRYVSTI
jgi:hypothetical protein